MPVWAVLDFTNTNCIERELLLAKVSILGPEYVEYQYQGGPTHEPRRADAREDKLEREASLVHNFEQSARPDAETTPAPLTPSQLLRMKSDHLQSISILAAQFDARMVDVSEHSVIVEMSGKTSKVEAFLNLLKPFGLLESARTGALYLLGRLLILAGVLTSINRFDGYAPFSFQGFRRRRSRHRGRWRCRREPPPSWLKILVKSYPCISWSCCSLHAMSIKVTISIGIFGNLYIVLVRETSVVERN